MAKARGEGSFGREKKYGTNRGELPGWGKRGSNPRGFEEAE